MVAHDVPQVGTRISGDEGQGQETGRLLGREQSERIVERHDEVRARTIGRPLEGELLENALDPRPVRVAHELLDIDADVGHRDPPADSSRSARSALAYRAGDFRSRYSIRCCSRTA